MADGPEARLGLALRRARESRDISLRALARTLHRSHSTLVEYERGHRLAPLDVVEAYEAELGLGAGTLIAVHEAARLELYGEDRSHLRTYVLRPAFDAPHQLPPDIAGFTGREAELSKLRALVAEGASETLVISAIAGTAGVGKTALAVHLAHQLAPDFTDAQLYVNLRGYEPGQRLNPTQVLDRFLRALGVPPDVLPKELDELAARYRGLLAGRRALVVLDNASSAEQVRPLLPASASCLVLVTSRDRLAGLVAAEGAQVLMLDVLPPSEALDLLSRTIGSGRVSAEPEAAGEVVRLCGCLPLAVRIAGARLATRPGMSLAALAERLSDERGRLGELSAGDVGVRASLGLSYRALHPEAARMFRRLGLIAGPDFARGVAAALTDANPEEAERLLEALVDAHLVEVAAAPGRYRFHDLLRLYAREQSQNEDADLDRDEALRRMFEWYLDGAHAAQGFQAPGRRRLPYQQTGRWQQPSFVTFGQLAAWFEAERASLVATVHQAALWGFNPTAWQLACALSTSYPFRSSWTEWHAIHQVGLRAAQQSGNRQAEAWLMTSLGHMYDAGKGLELSRQSVAIFREIQDPHGEARALSGLGGNYLALGRIEESLDCQQRALAICRSTGDLYGEGRALNHLGMTYRALRRLEEALGCLQRALAIRQELGYVWGNDGVLINLGNVYLDLHRFDEAIDCCQQSVAICREVRHRWGEGRSLALLGDCLRGSGDFAAARACWEEALAIFTELGAAHVDEVRAHLAESPEALQSNT
jgi:tetratricopeptide (TPR) repeat protein/transcriptional regulator with XRE-family HTH domain